MEDEQAELAAARTWVLAQVEKLGQYGGPSLRPSSLNSSERLAEPPPEIAGKIDARQRAGFSAEGLDYPRRSAAARGGVLAGLLSLLGLILVLVDGISLALGGGIVALIMTIAGLVALASGAGFGISVSLYANRDPLRLTHDERHALHETKRWQTRQNWIGPLSGSVERRLVIVARDVIERIVASPAWASGHLAAHRTRLNLGAELDQIDEQAFGLATLRAQLAAGVQIAGDQRAVAAEHGWQRLVDRVAGLAVYAQRLDGVQQRLAREAAEYEAAYADGTVARLVAGTVRDELAADTLRSLSEELSERNGNPALDGPATSGET
ncbi:MAG TPA: hypothetical protein VJ914_16795 [Pseudonocardiaceae bacterium]|nr:hypothetical protein [Pseudonocardiaceae bacterium]